MKPAVAYFDDLSEYVYCPTGAREGTLNVGWLAAGNRFDAEQPTDDLLDRLWEYCKSSVVQMRGIHECELCMPQSTVLASRNGDARILLGSAEIRVFGERGRIFAAPNLIYHYVRFHHYKPPDEFVRALIDSQFNSTDSLRQAGFDVWEMPLRNEIRAFGPGGVPVQKNVHVDED